jgi:hypothetical protein
MLLRTLHSPLAEAEGRKECRSLLIPLACTLRHPRACFAKRAGGLGPYSGRHLPVCAGEQPLAAPLKQ